jgi:hypothetical protein
MDKTLTTAAFWVLMLALTVTLSIASPDYAQTTGETESAQQWCENKKSELLTDAEEWLSKWFASSGNPDPQTVGQLQNLVDWIPAKISDCARYYNSEDTRILKSKAEEISKTLVDAGYEPSLKATGYGGDESGSTEEPPAIIDETTNKWCEDKALELKARDSKWFSLWVETMENPSVETVEQLEQLVLDTDKRLAGCTPYLTGETISILQSISNDTHIVLDDMSAGLYASPHKYNQTSAICRDWSDRLDDSEAEIRAMDNSGVSDSDPERYLSSVYKYNLDLDRYNTDCIGITTTYAENDNQ